MRRAQHHADMGNLEYAWGSLQKAVRRYRRARELDAIYDVPPHIAAQCSRIEMAVYTSLFAPSSLGLGQIQ